MTLARKLSIAKFTFIIYLLVGAAVSTAGLISAISYFRVSSGVRISILQLDSELKILSLLFKQVAELVTFTDSKDRSWSDDEKFRRWQLQKEFGEQAKIFPELLTIVSELEYLPQRASPPSGVQLTSALLSINKMRMIREGNLKQLAEKLTLSQRELVWMAILSALFGIGLPLAIFFIYRCKVKKLKTQAEHKIGRWISEWAEATKRHGDSFYQSPLFWIETVLAFTELLGLYTRHPASSCLASLARTFRDQLHPKDDKKKSKAASK